MIQVDLIPRSTRRLLAVVHPGPPAAGTDVFFHDDLGGLDSEQLKAECARLRLRLVFEDPRHFDRWPVCWLRERLRRVEGLLRRPHEARRTAGAPR